jgi:hypothetical protein
MDEISFEYAHHESDTHLYGHDESNIIKIDMNENKFTTIVPTMNIEEPLRLNFGISSDYRYIYCGGKDSAYKVDLNSGETSKESKISHVGNLVDSYITYTSDDEKFIIVDNHDNCSSSVIINGKTIHKFTSQEYEISNNCIYYITREDYSLNKFNVITHSLIKKLIELEVPSYCDFIVKDVIIIKYDKLINCYDIDTLELKYTIKNVYLYTDKYIFVCNRGRRGINLVKIYSDMDGSLINEININTPVYILRVSGKFLILNDMQEVNNTGMYVSGKYLYIYEISGKFVGKIIFSRIYDIHDLYISPNYKYLYVMHNNHLVIKSLISANKIKSFDISNLLSIDQKTEFLKGKYSPESSIARATANPLFDEHLFGEIFSMINNTVLL